MGAGIADVLVQPCSSNVFETGSYPRDSIAMNVGRDALNEATILSKHELNVELISLFGQDPTSAYIQSHCDACGIDLTKAYFDPSYQTGINVVLVKEDGSRHFLTNKNGALRKLELKHIPLTFESKVVCFASIFVFPFIQDLQLKTIFDYAHSKNSIVCADMTKCKNKETIHDLKESLSCIDTTGAGDSFVSGFIYGLCKDYSFEKCISIANEFGSKCVQFLGSTTWCK